jgi:hypothetical protein
MHHFGSAVVCWAIWKAEIKLFLTKSGSNTLLKSWYMPAHSCLIGHATIQEQIAGGVETMLAIAYRLLAHQRPPIVRMLPAPQDEAAEDEDNA